MLDYEPVSLREHYPKVPVSAGNECCRGLGHKERLRHVSAQETTLIDLTQQLVQALNNDHRPLRLFNPYSKEVFVLLRLDECSWTRDELQNVLWQVGKHLGWDAMDEYDEVDQSP